MEQRTMKESSLPSVSMKNAFRKSWPRLLSKANETRKMQPSIRIHFALPRQSLERLLEQEPVGFTTFTDNFFDNENYDLLKNNRWLRLRSEKCHEQKWTLKEQVSSESYHLLYNEYHGVRNVQTRMKITNAPDTSFPLRFATIPTRRYTYDFGGCHWWIDCCLMKDKYYVIGTLDLRLEKEQEILRNLEAIYPQRSKILAYLAIDNPKLLKFVIQDDHHSDEIAFYNCDPLNIEHSLGKTLRNNCSLSTVCIENMLALCRISEKPIFEIGDSKITITWPTRSLSCILTNNSIQTKYCTQEQSFNDINYAVDFLQQIIKEDKELVEAMYEEETGHRAPIQIDESFAPADGSDFW
jgi:hypothetical protein